MALCDVCKERPTHRWSAYGWGICQECLPGYTLELHWQYIAGALTFDELAAAILGSLSIPQPAEPDYSLDEQPSD